MKYIFKVLLISLITTPVYAKWYIVQESWNECIVDGSPKETINRLKEMKVEYTVKDVTEKGKVVKVTFRTKPNNEITFIRGKERCEKILKEILENNKKATSKYD